MSKAMLFFLSLVAFSLAESQFERPVLSAYANQNAFAGYGASFPAQINQPNAYRIQQQFQPKAYKPEQQIQYSIPNYQSQRQSFSSYPGAQIIPQQFAIAQQPYQQPYQQQRSFSSYFLKGEDLARQGQIQGQPQRIGANYGISSIGQAIGVPNYQPYAITSARAQPSQYSQYSSIKEVDLQPQVSSFNYDPNAYQFNPSYQTYSINADNQYYTN